jgi:hypothetical protein
MRAANLVAKQLRPFLLAKVGVKAHPFAVAFGKLMPAAGNPSIGAMKRRPEVYFSRLRLAPMTSQRGVCQFLDDRKLDRHGFSRSAKRAEKSSGSARAS